MTFRGLFWSSGKTPCAPPSPTKISTGTARLCCFVSFFVIFCCWGMRFKPWHFPKSSFSLPLFLFLFLFLSLFSSLSSILFPFSFSFFFFPFLFPFQNQFSLKETFEALPRFEPHFFEKKKKEMDKKRKKNRVPQHFWWGLVGHGHP